MFQSRAQHGAIFVWRQGEGTPDPATAAPLRGWALFTRGAGRSQITWRRPGATGGGASSVDLAVAGDDGTFSGAASSGPAVVLGVTGDDGTVAISASVPIRVDMAVTGDDGAFSAVATGVVQAESGGGRRKKKTQAQRMVAGTPYTHDDYMQWVVRTVAAVAATGVFDA